MSKITQLYILKIFKYIKNKKMNSKKFSGLIWLVGHWEGILGDGIYHEEWKITANNEMKGRAYLTNEGKINNNEILKLHEDSSGIHYTADVSHNSEPVSFLLTYADDKTFIFENPEHDFPTKITYVNNDNKSLTATVEAEIENRLKKFEYFLIKIL